jgi:hypothetical protein
MKTSPFIHPYVVIYRNRNCSLLDDACLLNKIRVIGSLLKMMGGNGEGATR